MKVGIFLISKEQIWFPQTLEHLGVNSEGITLKVSGESQTRVVPPLAKEYVDPVVLQTEVVFIIVLLMPQYCEHSKYGNTRVKQEHNSRCITIVVSWMDPKLLMKMLTLDSTGIPAIHT